MGFVSDWVNWLGWGKYAHIRAEVTDCLRGELRPHHCVSMTPSHDLEEDLEVDYKGDFRGDVKQDLEGDLLSSSAQVLSWSGSV